MERTLVPPSGIPVYLLPMAPPGSPRGIALLAVAAMRCLPLVLRLRPRVTIATGGYACVPAALASWLARVPVVLFLPDVVPAKAVRALVPLARRVAAPTEDSLAYLPAEKTVVTGYPLREAFRDLSPERGRQRFGIPSGATVLCVFGGSLGARAINQALASCLPVLLAGNHVIHVCGRERLSEAEAAAADLGADARSRYHLFPYLEAEEMASALAAADLVLSRSGASLLGELPAAGTPAVLVPLPLSGVIQRANAEFLARHGAAVILDEQDLPTELDGVLRVLLADRGRLVAMAAACRALYRPDAAERIADLALEVAR